MLIRRVVEDQLRDYAKAARMRFFQESLEIAQSSVSRVDVRVIGDVVPVILPRRRAERQDPYGRHTQILQVIELLRQPREVAHAVARLIEKRADVDFVDDRVLVPKGIVFQRERLRHRWRRMKDSKLSSPTMPRICYKVFFETTWLIHVDDRTV